MVATLSEDGADALLVGPRMGECPDARLLNEGRDAREGMLHYFVESSHDLGGSDRISDAPTGHRIDFREASDRDDRYALVGNARRADVTSVIDQRRSRLCR